MARPSYSSSTRGCRRCSISATDASSPRPPAPRAPTRTSTAAAAHAGAGLGDRFLRHLDRTRLLVHLLDASASEPGRTPLRDYETMIRELALYDPELAARPQLVVLNKLDLPEVRKRAKQIARP